VIAGLSEEAVLSDAFTIVFFGAFFARLAATELAAPLAASEDTSYEIRRMPPCTLHEIDMVVCSRSLISLSLSSFLSMDFLLNVTISMLALLSLPFLSASSTQPHQIKSPTSAYVRQDYRSSYLQVNTVL